MHRVFHCNTAAIVLSLAALSGASPAVLAGDPAPEVKKEKSKKSKPGELKKYNEVITPKAKTSRGVFTVHRIDDKAYFEIPPSALGKLMLWSTEVAKAPAGVGWGGSALGNRVVRWERRGPKVLLWRISFEKRADGKAVERAVESADLGSIIMAFNVETEGKDKAPVIDVTTLFTSDLPEFSAKRLANGAQGVDPSRSFVEEVKAFPTNIETRALLTFKMGSGPAAATGRTGPPLRAGGGGLPGVSMLIHYSMTLLPERPMQGRFFDPRVGYFTRSFEDYAHTKTWVVKNKYIARFRLEKKDPQAEVSEPVKPIVFYLSREVPERWRSFMKQGVEDWQPAFEKAGFKNAIICRDAPTSEEDPSWDPEDARYSVIRWVAVPIMNAMGPHVHDPRSGEIVSAHIIMWHDVLKLVQQWYFVQCGAVDERARRLPLPDDLIGELIRYVVAHEVGHTLGLRHNHRASSAYTVAQLRDPKFTARHGTVASIMSYGRFNYVAQPEDKVQRLIPKIAPYDYFAIEWGYRPIAAKSADDELPQLDKWAARQMTDPWIRFGGEDGPAVVDPTVKTENIGADTLQATALGLKNLDRVVDILVPATTKLGEDYSLLEETYKTALSHRARWFGAVATIVGGVVETRSLAGRGSESFTRISKEKQQEAVRFLLDHAFATPRKLLQPALVSRFAYFAVADEVMNQQKSLLQNLLSGRRFQLLMDAEVFGPEKSYSSMQFLSDVQDGVWSELAISQPQVDVCRRHLQRAYLEHIKNELNPKQPALAAPIARRGDEAPPKVFSASTQGTDFRAVARAALRTLGERIDVVLPRVQDVMTRVHLQDCRREIELILNPKS
jgi:hypothetical protein